MMDKQINLYRNVFEATERRRRGLIWVSVAAIMVLSCSWIAWGHLNAERVALARQAGDVDTDLAGEKSVIELLGIDLKKRQATASVSAQNTRAQDLLRAGSKTSNESAALSVALGAWKTEGAALRKATYDQGVLVVSGEARGPAQANRAVADLMQSLSNQGSWQLVSKEMREPELGSARMDFKVTARAALREP